MRRTFADLWDRAIAFDEFVAASTEHCGLWTGVFSLARVPQWAMERGAALRGRLRLVVLTEDWCGDATNTLPVLAKWVQALPNVELRVLRRDEHPALMDHYLTDGVARSIPVVIVLDDAMVEHGWWGPRPRALQTWVMDERAKGRDKKDLYPEIRRWYAKDRGETTVREVLELMERAAAAETADAS